jgi:hypothetical protein
VTAVLRRRHVYSRRREVHTLLIAVLMIVAAGVLWHLIRPTVTLALARGGIPWAGRERFLGQVLQDLYPDLIGYKGVAWPYLLRRGRVAIWRTASQQHLFDGALRRVGSVWSYLQLLPCPDGFDDDGGLKLALPYHLPGAAGRSSAACGLIRLRQHTAVVTGVIVAPGISSVWKDTNNDGELEIAFWTAPPFRVTTSIKLDRSGIPIPDALPTDGSVLVWTPPDGRPRPIPDRVEATEFFRQLLPLPPVLGTSTPTATTSTRSSSP